MKNLIRVLSVMVVWLFVTSTPAVSAVNSYHCPDGICSCTGDSDCNDMFTNAGCGDLSYCTTTPDGKVFCQCLQRPGQPSKAGNASRLPFTILAVDLQAGKVTVEEKKNGPRATIPVGAPLLRSMKVGGKLYVRENSTVLVGLRGALAAQASKKTARECDKCRNDCHDAVKKKFHLVMKDGLEHGDAGWEAALRNCLSDNGCTGKDCP